MTPVSGALLFVVLAVMLLGVSGSRTYPDAGDVQGWSLLATWECTGDPCPWGQRTSGQAAVWPVAAEPIRSRQGYTVSHGVYAEASRVAGWKVSVTAGRATVYAGSPTGSQVPLATLHAGQSLTVPATLGADDVVSLESDAEFEYDLSPGAPPTPEPARTSWSVPATWECRGTLCPWGHRTSGQALEWPVIAEPVRSRQGYVVSHGVYARASKVAGWTVSVLAGSATVYAGSLTDATATLATLEAGASLTVPATLDADDLVSLEGDAKFEYVLTPSARRTQNATRTSWSVLATWDCTGTPCPWGRRTSGQALDWPVAAEPIRSRQGYSVSHGVYAEASRVAGWKVSVIAGRATIYAGPLTGSQASLATVQAGESFTLPATFGAGDVVSVQSDAKFEYALSSSAPPAQKSTSRAARTSASVPATWDCTGTPCPWGNRTSGQALEWPTTAEPIRSRQGYTVSAGVYARASRVAGWKVSVVAGRATVYAGPPTGSHAPLVTLQDGQSLTVPPTLAAGDVVSVQSDAEFEYAVTPGPAPASSPQSAGCTNPTRCNPVSWVASRWRYDGGGRNPGDWHGGVITWPSWSAHSSNKRSGADSRTVYDSMSGKKLYPYMGPWADGCGIRVVSGSVLVIEWERGRDDWRETRLSTGDTYKIVLTGRENSAMIETPNNSEPFEVALSNCTPQRIRKGSSD